MSNQYDDRDEERDWPDDTSHHPLDPVPTELSEVADESGQRPIRRLPPRKRAGYHPPSEFDRE